MDMFTDPANQLTIGSYNYQPEVIYQTYHEENKTNLQKENLLKIVDKTMKLDAESRNSNQFPKMRFKNYSCSYGSNIHNMVA
jgi:hypothetical protein